LPKRTETYDLAYRACSELFGETGKPPTIASVKERISVNSPVTIKKAIDDWLIHLAADFISRREKPGIPDILFESISSLWKSALTEAEKTLDQKSKALSEQEREIGEHLKKTDDQLKTALQEKDQLAVRFKDQEQYAQHLKEELKVLRSEQVAVLEDAKVARQAYEESTKQSINLQAKYDEAQQHWQERLDNEHDWMLKRIQDEKERIDQAQKQEMNQLVSKAESLRLDKITGETRLSQAQSLADKLLEKNDTLSQSEILLTKKTEKMTAHIENQEEIISSLKKQLLKNKKATNSKKPAVSQKSRQRKVSDSKSR
jgi:hypothetical protein